MKEEILKNIQTKWLGRNLLYFKTVTSTNDEAKKIAATAPNGLAVIAERQTMGKGRLGKHWETTAGNPVAISIIIHSQLAAQEISKITLLAGYSVACAIKKITQLNTQIKWPNDILINNKKVCGILAESCLTQKNGTTIVLGIGINVNNDSFPLDLKGATSLKIESGLFFDRIELIQALFHELENNYEKYIHNFNNFIELYKINCITIGKEITINNYNNKYTAHAIGINTKGELIILEKDGAIKTINSGEVSISNNG